MGVPQGDEGQWFWSSGLLTQLVPAPIWGCCLSAPYTICPLHTHLATSLGPVAFWQSVVDLGQIPHLSAPHMASTSDSLAMRSLSELPSGILGDGAPGLGGFACPSRSWEHRSQPLPRPSDTSLQSSPSIQGIKDQSMLGLSLTPPPALLTLHSLNATGTSSLTVALSKHKLCKAPAETCTGTTAPRILG